MTTKLKSDPLADALLKFHPLAKGFPPMVGDEFKGLVSDIETNGLREPITLYRGQILDGIHRYRACLRLKIESQFVEFEGDDAAATAFVISKNIARRHLKAKEKRDLIAKLLKADPNKSDRQVAEMTNSGFGDFSFVFGSTSSGW